MLPALYSNAQRYDHQWVFGYGIGEEDRFGLNLLDFHNGEVEVSYYGPSLLDYDIGISGSIINDTSGYILLHTNHCTVRDTQWNVISGEEFITTTGTGVDACTDGVVNAYGSYQGCVLLPDLQNPSRTYLLHKDEEIDFEAQDIFSNHLWFSTIERGADGSFVFEKRYEINTDAMLIENLTACPNAGKDAWWVVMPRHNSNVFDRYLIQNDTVIVQDTQEIGIILKPIDLQIGQAQYSPDARYFAINSETHGVLLYGFDNITGRLSDFRNIPYPNDENEAALGLCFSPNSRFIYVATTYDTYQIDLENNDEVYHVGYYRSADKDGWPVGLGMVFAGPDCRLYVSPGSTTHYLHVILAPDEKGAACQFAERVIHLPGIVDFHLPNMPQYRYLTGCDSTIAFPFTVTTEDVLVEKNAVKVFPNPASSNITVELTQRHEQDITCRLLDCVGGVVKEIIIPAHHTQWIVNIENIPTGVYFLGANDGCFNTQKVVITR